MAKVTFTLDEETVRTLKKLAERAKKPQSMVVREAVAHYAARDERMTDQERARKLHILDEMLARPPARTAEKVDRELRAIRASRRGPHRRHPLV